MNQTNPVYTVEAECQDCYKCVRHCPVKAIRVRDGHAQVIPEMCVACGKCVEVCPVKAKQVRNDLARLKVMLTEKIPVYASLAPSWVSEFADLPAGRMISALRKAGFTGVSETAIGAELVSAKVAAGLDKSKGGLLLSSACPTAVDFIRRYIPNLAPNITDVGSPLMSHCRFLRDTFGNEIRVVFIGPCIAKKNEADRNPDLLNLAITYPELKQLFREQGIDPAEMTPSADDRFVPRTANEGARYPVEGGMNDTIKFRSGNKKVLYTTVTGLNNIRASLQGIENLPPDELVFVELLACPGGCVHGPCAEHKSPILMERLRVLEKSVFPEKPAEAATPGSIEHPFPADAVSEQEPAAGEIIAALRSIGKTKPEDELNCDGCGYNTCRNFARALISGHAEPSMCVSYLRKQAQKKANALLRSIPSGVVIADKNLNIIECNRSFAELFGADTVNLFEACPGLAGADLRRIVPFANLFESALGSGQDVRRDSFKYGKRLYSINIFIIEPAETVGGVIYDVTETEFRREQIAERAKRVIENNIATVQEIASKLGEQMADTELLLRSIADDYADENTLLGETPEKKE